MSAMSFYQQAPLKSDGRRQLRGKAQDGAGDGEGAGPARSGDKQQPQPNNGFTPGRETRGAPEKNVAGSGSQSAAQEPEHAEVTRNRRRDRWGRLKGRLLAKRKGLWEIRLALL